MKWLVYVSITINHGQESVIVYPFYMGYGWLWPFTALRPWNSSLAAFGNDDSPEMDWGGMTIFQYYGNPNPTLGHGTNVGKTMP